jgi:hypothetical protein
VVVLFHTLHIHTGGILERVMAASPAARTARVWPRLDGIPLARVGALLTLIDCRQHARDRARRPPGRYAGVVSSHIT